jgi:2-polyprenyl-6-methoxyphenol hydroxylase-like FAD-dependent oxidoreductase
MKVVIVGAGLAGLSTAISLRKYVHSRYRELEIKIYDKGDAGSDWAGAQGAALGLQGNGLKALQDIDPELRDKVYKIGFPCTHFTHKADNGWLLGREYLDVLPISRPLLIKCLLESLPKSAVSYKTVSKIVAEQGRKPKVMFEDGSEEIADLVIGADGLRSIVRRSLFGNDEQYRQQYQ